MLQICKWVPRPDGDQQATPAGDTDLLCLQAYRVLETCALFLMRNRSYWMQQEIPTNSCALETNAALISLSEQAIVARHFGSSLTPRMSYVDTC